MFLTIPIACEERAAVIDTKIAFHADKIKALEAQKKAVLTPKARKPRLTTKAVADAAKKAGMSPTEMLEKLGLTI